MLRVLPFLAEVYILGSEVERDGHRWVPIRLKPEHGGQQGWVARRWLVAVPLSAARTSSSGNPGGPGLLGDPQRLRVVKGSGAAQYAALNGVRYHIADLTTLQVLNLGGYEQVSDGVIASLRVGPVLRFFPRCADQGRWRPRLADRPRLEAALGARPGHVYRTGFYLGSSPGDTGLGRGSFGAG